MFFECTDILLVETGDASVFVVEAPSNMADVGSFVRFDGGTIGTVTQRAFIGSDRPLLALIRALSDTYPAESIFLRYWQKEDAHADP